MQADTLFEILKNVPSSELPSLIKIPAQDFLPKKSKSLAKNLIKDILTTNEPRLLVIKGHLYFDHILERMINKEGILLSQKNLQSFNCKLNAIWEKRAIDTHFLESLRAINQLRNKFAHDIFFDISQWDPRCIPFTYRHSFKILKRKDLLRAFNIILVRLTFFVLIIELSQNKRWLLLENMPEYVKNKS